MAHRDQDLDWLYRRETEPEATAVLNDRQQAELRQATNPPQAPHRAGTSSRSRTPQVGQPTPQPPTTTRRRKRRGGLRLFGALVLAWVLFLIGTPLYAWLVTTTIEATPEGQRVADQPGTTVLLVGSDARDDLTSEQQSRLGTGSSEGRRTDTMLLLHTPAKGKPVLLSLPRDSYLPIPGQGENKLNAAYALGGAGLLVHTIEEATGIRIDGYLEVGFTGIVDLVDAVGGVEVCPTFDIDDQDSHLQLNAGCQMVDGVTALGYVRMRKQDPRGDLGRVERQREVISALSKRLASPLTVLNPVTYWQVNMAAAGSLRRGSDTGLIQVGQAGMGLLSTVSGAGLSLTVPVANANASTSAGSAVLWDDAAAQEIFQAIAAGDTTALEQLR